MESYQWPGNVRELKNIIEFLVVSTSVPFITHRDLPEHIRDYWKLEIPQESSAMKSQIIIYYPQIILI